VRELSPAAAPQVALVCTGLSACLTLTCITFWLLGNSCRFLCGAVLGGGLASHSAAYHQRWHQMAAAPTIIVAVAGIGHAYRSSARMDLHTWRLGARGAGYEAGSGFGPISRHLTGTVMRNRRTCTTSPWCRAASCGRWWRWATAAWCCVQPTGASRGARRRAPPASRCAPCTSLPRVSQAGRWVWMAFGFAAPTAACLGSGSRRYRRARRWRRCTSWTTPPGGPPVTPRCYAPRTGGVRGSRWLGAGRIPSRTSKWRRG
jgi:hypothetical protein